MRKKRFIAGAVCPRCGEMDKIMADENAVYCVACHFEQPSPQAQTKTVETAQTETLLQTLRLED